MDEIIKALKDDDIALLGEWVREVPEVLTETDRYGRTILAQAIDHGSVAAIQLLLDVGADPNYETWDGFPALYSAVDRDTCPDQHEIIQLLAAAGVDLHTRGINDWTPLHLAAVNGRKDLVELLVELGADLTVRTRIDDYATPAEEVRLLGIEDMFRFIASLEKSRIMHFLYPSKTNSLAL